MRASVLLVALLLCACNREPDFDERYKAANQRINQAAQEIDAQITEVPERAERTDQP